MEHSCLGPGGGAGWAAHHFDFGVAWPSVVDSGKGVSPIQTQELEEPHLEPYLFRASARA